MAKINSTLTKDLRPHLISSISNVAMVYVKRYKWKMILALSLSAISAIVALIDPLQKGGRCGDTRRKYLYSIFVDRLFAVYNCQRCTRYPSAYYGKSGQLMIYDIRKDLFAHLQELPFSIMTTDRRSKILVRVVNYVNNVSDMLTNGIINFILEIFNLIFITIFVFLG